MALTGRFGKVRLFAAVRDAEDDAYAGLQLGVTTYGTADDTDEETYQTSYFEWGGRSDHLADALANAQGNEVADRLVSESGDDVRYVGSMKQNDRIRNKGTQPAAA